MPVTCRIREKSAKVPTNRAHFPEQTLIISDDYEITLARWLNEAQLFVIEFICSLSENRPKVEALLTLSSQAGLTELPTVALAAAIPCTYW